jgi:hypothetical protein
MGRTPKRKKGKKEPSPEPEPSDEHSEREGEDPHNEENETERKLRELEKAEHDARLKQVLTSEAEARALLDATMAKGEEMSNEIRELKKALAQSLADKTEDEVPKDDLQDLANPSEGEESSSGNRRLTNEREGILRKSCQAPLTQDWETVDKIPLPPHLDEKMSVKDINSAIQRVVKANSPPNKAAPPDEWDSYIRILYRHWVGGRWPNNTVSAAALGSAIGFQFNPMQDLQSLLGDINISMGNDTPMSLTSESDHFQITTKQTLAIQAVAFLNLIRTEEEDYAMSMNDDRCRDKLIKKIAASPFRLVWNAVCLQYDGGQDAIKDLQRAIKLCQNNHIAPLIGQPTHHPAIGLNRLNPAGTELKKAQEAVNSPHCLACDATDHSTEECSLIHAFHKRNQGVYRPKDWTKPQVSHCAIHGACTHLEADCTVLPKLRNEPQLQLRGRQPRVRKDTTPKKEKPDKKRQRENDTNKLLIQRLDQMEKCLKKMTPQKEKIKKAKPAPLSESDSGSNS